MQAPRPPSFSTSDSSCCPSPYHMLTKRCALDAAAAHFLSYRSALFHLMPYRYARDACMLLIAVDAFACQETHACNQHQAVGAQKLAVKHITQTSTPLQLSKNPTSSKTLDYAIYSASCQVPPGKNRCPHRFTTQHLCSKTASPTPAPPKCTRLRLPTQLAAASGLHATPHDSAPPPACRTTPRCDAPYP